MSSSIKVSTISSFANDLASLFSSQISSNIMGLFVKFVKKCEAENVENIESLVEIIDTHLKNHNIGDIKNALFLEDERRKIVEAKLKKRQDSEPCAFIGPKSKTQCSSPGKIKYENKVYCVSHHNQISKKHNCCFIKNAKDGEQTICEVSFKGEETCDIDFEYKGVNYYQKWLCKKHIDKLQTEVNKEITRCPHIYETGKVNINTQCKSQMLEGYGHCRSHLTKEEKEHLKKTTEEKSGKDEQK